jgi:short chain dehydrogenase
MTQQRVRVTAGASGIGREIARAFADAGAHVFVADIDAEGLEALERDILGVQTAVCDMSSRPDIERMVPEAVAALASLRSASESERSIRRGGETGRDGDPIPATVRRSPRHCGIGRFLASDAGKSISGQILPIDNDMQQAL